MHITIEPNLLGMGIHTEFRELSRTDDVTRNLPNLSVHRPNAEGWVFLSLMKVLFQEVQFFQHVDAPNVPGHSDGAIREDAEIKLPANQMLLDWWFHNGRVARLYRCHRH